MLEQQAAQPVNAIDDRISEIDEVMADCTRHMKGLDAAMDDCARHMKELTRVRRQLMLRRADLLADVDQGFDTDRARIKRLVPVATGISWLRITGGQRARPVVQARWLAVHMLYERGYTSAEIGRQLGKDHTTILHARDAWPAFIADQANAEFAETARACWHQFNRDDQRPR